MHILFILVSTHNNATTTTTNHLMKMITTMMIIIIGGLLAPAPLLASGPIEPLRTLFIYTTVVVAFINNIISIQSWSYIHNM